MYDGLGLYKDIKTLSDNTKGLNSAEVKRNLIGALRDPVYIPATDGIRNMFATIKAARTDLGTMDPPTVLDGATAGTPGRATGPGTSTCEHICGGIRANREQQGLAQCTHQHVQCRSSVQTIRKTPGANDQSQPEIVWKTGSDQRTRKTSKRECTLRGHQSWIQSWTRTWTWTWTG